MSFGPSASALTAHAFVSWSTTTIVKTEATIHAERARTRVGDALPAPLATCLALHALLGPRDHFQPRDRDAIAARHAQSVRAEIHPLQRPLDVIDGLARTGRQCEVAFAFDAHGVALARLLV